MEDFPFQNYFAPNVLPTYLTCCFLSEDLLDDNADRVPLNIMYRFLELFDQSIYTAGSSSNSSKVIIALEVPSLNMVTAKIGITISNTSFSKCLSGFLANSCALTFCIRTSTVR